MPPTGIPNLKILKIYALDLFNITNSAFRPDHYPKLEVVGLGVELSCSIMESCLNSCNTPFPTVSELELMESGNLDLFRKAHILFPSVTSFTWNECFNFDHVPFAISGWKLESLTFKQSWEFKVVIDLLSCIPMEGVFIIYHALKT
jgi:hypothetical protein